MDKRAFEKEIDDLQIGNKLDIVNSVVYNIKDLNRCLLVLASIFSQNEDIKKACFAHINLNELILSSFQELQQLISEKDTGSEFLTD